MKTFFRFTKTIILSLLLLAAGKIHAQLGETYTTFQGQCVDLGIDSFLGQFGMQLDTFYVLSAPQHGQIVPGGRPDSWIYCPDSAFVGTDQAYVYYCTSGPILALCDSPSLTFQVQSGACSAFAVTLQYGPCAGPLQSLQAVAAGGTPPYQYSWSNGMVSDVACNLTPGNYCVTVTDSLGCSQSNCFDLSWI